MTCGDDHPDTLVSVSRMGVFLYDLGRYKEAVAHVRATSRREPAVSPWPSLSLSSRTSASIDESRTARFNVRVGPRSSTSVRDELSAVR
jgi:hypothetical protein